MSFLNFGKKQRQKEKTSESTENNISDLRPKSLVESPQIVKRPRICCIDLSEQTVNRLKKSGANIFVGSIGPKINVPNTKPNQAHTVVPRNDLPNNLHEFDVVIIDLHNFTTINWSESEHTKREITGKSSILLLSSFPETLFDLRPWGSDFLGIKLKKIKRKFLILAFSTKAYDHVYESGELNNESYFARRTDRTRKCNIYSFWDDIPLSENLSGEEIRVVKTEFTSLATLLDKHLDNATYHQTFNHPVAWDGMKQVKDPDFFPLMTNIHDDIISFASFGKNGNLFVFPQIHDKTNFVIDFLSNIAPTFFPEIFPYSATFKWKDEKKYWLPKHSELLSKKDLIQITYEKQIENIDSEIKENLANQSFLHDILTETDSLLVEAIIKFLKWLGFEHVHSIDDAKSNSSIKEEDIRVDLKGGGLLVIECKGIGGTSTDSDCNQISKIKHRRCKQRNAFDVFALYVVNHQRYLPPLKRENPPFNAHQIEDAVNDERGLLSTWQLFNLYFDIENKIITKEEARELILNFGLVDFRPKNLVCIDKPKEILKEGKVCIVNIDDKIILEQNDLIFVEKNGRFSLTKIIEIQHNDENVDRATMGEFGLKLSEQIQNNSILWKKVRE